MPSRKDAGPNSSFFSLKRRKSPDSSDVSNDARRRITIACVRCRHRKIRCDGSDPCNKCSSSGADCQYNAVTKEENQAAREKKALAKATRTKSAKQAGTQTSSSVVRKDEKPGSHKKRSFKIRRASSSAESSATPEPMQHQDQELDSESDSETHKRPRLHIEPAYTLPDIRDTPTLPAMHEHSLEQDDAHSASDSVDTYFGYLSSSTASLQSSIYEPVYSHEPAQFLSTHQDYTISPATLSLEPSNYPAYSFLPAEEKLQESAPALSYPMESRQPSGLCLYLDETHFSTTNYTPYASASNPVTPALLQQSNFPQPSPPSYHGPIDWTSRPLAPYQGIVHPQPQYQHQHHQQQAQFYQRARSYSDLPMYTQTVSMDQVCSAGV